MTIKLLYATKCLICFQNKYLLLFSDQRKRRNKSKFNYWDLPGGLMEPKRTEEENLRGEINEELGISIRESLEFIGYIRSRITKKESGTRFHILAIVMKVELVEEPAISLSDEHSDYEWVDRDELMKRLQVKYRAEDLELLRF